MVELDIMRNKHIRVNAKIVYILSFLLIFTSCSGLKNLPKEELALTKSTLRLITTDTRVNKGAIRSDLAGLVKQQPVKKNPLNPRTYGKPLTVYNPNLTRQTAETMQQYLRNNRGFYHCTVGFREVIKGRKIELTYDIDLGPRAYISTLTYESEDERLLALITPESEDSIIKIGFPLDAQLFDRERTRIVEAIKNNGYAEFNANYVEYRGDSTAAGVDVSFFLYGPIIGTQHKRFTIGEVNVFTEHLASGSPSFALRDSIESLHYFARSDQFIVDPLVIHRAISLRPGSIYKKSDEFQTTRNVYRLSPYRLVTIDPFLKNPDDSLYNYNIFMTTRDNKWAFDMGVNFFYSNFNQISDQDLIGFNGSVGMQNRNFKNKAIRHSFGIDGTFELNISNLSANSVSLQFNNRFEVPKIVKFFDISGLLKFFGFLDETSISEYKQITNTDIDFNFGHTSILNFYNLRDVNTSFAYTYQPNNRNRFVYKPLGISVLDTDIKARFRDEILSNNILLAKSFDDYLLTGFLIRELSYFKQIDYGKKTSLSIIGNFEASGLENYFINKSINLVSSYKEKWKLYGLNFAEFIRVEADLRYNTKIKDRSTFAARMNAAVAVPFTGGVEVPFVKQYFVGGPNSIRGWQLRELGPGAHSLAMLNPRPGQPFFQTGEVKFEMNAEYRFDLFWFWEGALFIDAGNVWTLKDDVSRPGAQISTSMFDQMAMSIGWGLRADFDYFLLRFDFGYKLRNPFPDPETGERFILTNGFYNGTLGNINFAINYPF